MGKCTRMATMFTLRQKKIKASVKFAEFFATSSKIIQVCLFWKFNGNVIGEIEINFIFLKVLLPI